MVDAAEGRSTFVLDLTNGKPKTLTPNVGFTGGSTMVPIWLETLSRRWWLSGPADEVGTPAAVSGRPRCGAKRHADLLLLVDGTVTPRSAMRLVTAAPSYCGYCGGDRVRRWRES